MALIESLSKFKQQQEKCQSTLTNINTRAGSSRAAVSSHKYVPVATSYSTVAKAPAIKFSDDTLRLQHINSVQKGAIGEQLKRVIDLMLESLALYKQKLDEMN